MKMQKPRTSAWLSQRTLTCSGPGRRATSMSIDGCSLYLKQAAAPKKTSQANAKVAISLAQVAGCAVM